ncbi:acetyltransferase [Haloechinothrix alba]|uniref:Acetyltransferase n=1 Tax=Haloechinothrix alba TaxID=664784 RepID=A0A238YVK3_9PSEU|nr:acetate--CoA ligase family protein [Haloechinothrix alba]SNR75080.1 acetyltransferase [Haloechinothrix alba]
MTMAGDLQAMFAPRTVAVIGGSRTGGKLGAVMARSLSTYEHGCALVNARHPDPAEGVYGSLREAVAATGRTIDLVVLCVPANATATALGEAHDAGARAAVICSGGFAEIGQEGAEHQRAVLEVVARTGIRVLGPNTSGFVAPQRGLVASFVPAAAQLPAGPVGIVATSGGVNHALAFALADAGVGSSLAAGLGAGVDVTAPDVLEYLATDPATEVVALHIESVADGRRLLEAVRSTVRAKPVVALVTGRSDVAAFARSHTGALATSWRTTRAALRQAGAVLVDDDRELVDALTALSHLRLEPAADPGIGVITAQAGPGLLVEDRLRTDGLRIPELSTTTRSRIGEVLPPLTYQHNPVDTGRPGAGFGTVLRSVADDPAIDLVATYMLTEPDAIDLVSAVQEAGLPERAPAVVTLGGPADDTVEVRDQLHKIGVPALSSPTGTANATRALVADARARYRGAGGSGTTRQVPLAPAGTVDEAAAKEFLHTLDVPVPDSRVCDSREQACQALAELGPGVAVKILDATILHKTDVGGVHLDIRTESQLADALDALEGTGATRYLVEEMAPSGVDLVVGARRDPVFGPIVLCGLGGTATEALADVSVRVAPLEAAEAMTMPDELAGRALLGGWRGGPVLDRGEFARVITSLGGVLLAHPHVSEIEINPLRVTGSGLVALDAVLTPRQEEG